MSGEVSKGLGVMAVIAKRMVDENLPRALAIKERVDRGEVLTEREEWASVAIASNAPFSDWGKTFTDARLAAARVERSQRSVSSRMSRYDGRHAPVRSCGDVTLTVDFPRGGLCSAKSRSAVGLT